MHSFEKNYELEAILQIWRKTFEMCYELEAEHIQSGRIEK